MKLPIILLSIFFTISLASCNKCKTCTLIEKTSAGTAETDLGEVCGKQLNEYEHSVVYCLGECYYQCE
ncbi:MAG: hypothetical protein NWS74_07090 [Salibacteraceae bacterium]|nr:hypothetical protein [Salibacteraceae bacterium]MDP4686226.1 hypothetical protein [Salibacteraceae bacterium]MDP4763288.1 hypothetical protein [Salibacteraceae bacterium]MDP4843999.1 hypothetical protein [Salibacteraceae bacterium]MDP4935544.1 hypothetical protein [Salibacteraceae bacterium]